MAATAEIELPSEHVKQKAKAALSELMPPEVSPNVELRARRDRKHAEAAIPKEAYRLFIEVLKQLAEGNAVTIVPVHAELTTQQAADILNVSRPYLVQMLEKKRIPFHKVGTHRRLYAKDLLAYKRQDDKRRRQMARELTQLAEENEEGY